MRDTKQKKIERMQESIRHIQNENAELKRELAKVKGGALELHKVADAIMANVIITYGGAEKKITIPDVDVQGNARKYIVKADKDGNKMVLQLLERVESGDKK